LGATPPPVSPNTNAGSIAIGEKAANLILNAAAAVAARPREPVPASRSSKGMPA